MTIAANLEGMHIAIVAGSGVAAQQVHCHV